MSASDPPSSSPTGGATGPCRRCKTLSRPLFATAGPSGVPASPPKLTVLTGDDLIAFVNNDEAMRPDGVRGPGLFAYLRGLQGANGGDRRDVIATVFKGTVNRMVNGYLLRDVVNRVDEIHFTSSDEIHTLSALYESMLKEMRDAAGDSGEFYTPRPVIRFMVAATDPRLGETVLDPAAGTGGFLVEAYKHLEAQAQTVEDRDTLQRRSIYGGEAKPLPYLLAQMNLLLHGMEYPQIDPGNSLRIPAPGDRRPRPGGRDPDQPAVRGRGGARHPGQLPRGQAGRRDHAAVPAAHHAQAAPARRTGAAPGWSCRTAPCSATGCARRIKEELLTQFNLHTIVRLPNGVFAPYTSIPTNLLFFDRSGPTETIWYYELPLPAGRKQYTKTQSLQFEEFAECLDWWRDRQENAHAWRVAARDVLKDDAAGALVSANLDVKNPNAAADLAHLPPEELAESILRKEQRIAEIIEGIMRSLVGGRQ